MSPLFANPIADIDDREGRIVFGPERGVEGWYLIENWDGTVCVAMWSTSWGWISMAEYGDLGHWAAAATGAPLKASS